MLYTNHLFVQTLQLFYLCLSATQIVFGLGSKVKDVKKIYLVSSVLYGILVILAFGLSVWHITEGASLPIILIGASGKFEVLSSVRFRQDRPSICNLSEVTGFGTFFIAAMLYGRTCSMMSTFFQVRVSTSHAKYRKLDFNLGMMIDSICSWCQRF